VNANLYIGSKFGPTSTFFQLGSDKRPHETLIVHGDVAVCVDGTCGLSSRKKKPTFINRLTLGVENNKKVKPILMISSSPQKPRTLSIGARPEIPKYPSGQLFVYRGAIRPADPLLQIGGHKNKLLTYWTGYKVVLRNAELSGFKCSFYFISRNVQIQNTVFDNCAGIYGFSTKNPIQNCVFSNCRAAIRGPHGKLRRVENCVFENNQRNWILNNIDIFELIDCDIGTCSMGNLYIKKKSGCFKKFQEWRTMAVSRRHVFFKVVDEDGNPVAKATINTFCEFSGLNINARTGADGCHPPGFDREKAVLLTEYTEKATDIPSKPCRKDFFYDITINAPGFKSATIAKYAPKKSWEPIRVTLERQ